MRLLILSLFFSFLFADVDQQIKNFYKSHYPTIKIESVSSNRPFPKTYKNLSFKLANPKHPSSTVIIDGKYYYYTIKAKIGVYKADRVIRINRPVKPNVHFEYVNFRNFYSKPLFKIPEDIIASKIISKNAVINESNTKHRPLVLKNESVPVIFKDKNIEIYSKGTALKDAGANDTVRVKVNGKIFRGVLNSNGEVIIK